MIDAEYLLNIDEEGESLEFFGLSRTDIRKNGETWEIVDALDATAVMATAVEKSISSREYPLGTMEWESLNDTCGLGIHQLKMSECEKVE